MNKINTKFEYIVVGMDCPDCAKKIEKTLSKIPEILSINIDYITSKMRFETNFPNETDNKVRKAITSIGYKIQNSNTKDADVSKKSDNLHHILFLIIPAFFIIMAFMVSGFVDRWTEILLLSLGILSGGYPITKKAIAELSLIQPGINLLMSLAVIGAMIIGEWNEAAVVVLLFSLAEWLESFSIEKARKSIKSLFDIVPSAATMILKNKELEVPVKEIQTGSILRIKPGFRIPLDGKVVKGNSIVDQAPVTGESKPVEKRVGDDVYSGTVNQSGAFDMEVTSIFENSMISNIIHLIEEAQACKTNAERFIDRFSKYYTPIVVSFAFLLSFLPSLFGYMSLSESVYRALVLLVIACPCALVISTPVAVTSALHKAAKLGIILKGGAFLETFSHIKAIAFDKTGTLTYGKPSINSIIVIDGYAEEELIKIAASIENYSEHPLAQPFKEYLRHQNFDLKAVDGFRSIPGKGIMGQVDGQFYMLGNGSLFEKRKEYPDLNRKLIAENGDLQNIILIGTEERILGAFLLSDTRRPDIVPALSELRKSGINHLVMLSGDRKDIAVKMARELGLDSVEAELLPDQKLKTVVDLEKKYDKIAMVGDGINDAPALSRATVGIAMGNSGTDIAMESADVVLMNDDMACLPLLRKLSQKTVATIKQNIMIALSLKFIFFALAIPGYATLWMAVFADMGASLIVIFNGLRLMNFRK